MLFQVVDVNNCPGLGKGMDDYATFEDIFWPQKREWGVSFSAAFFIRGPNMCYKWVESVCRHMCSTFSQ